MNKRERHERIQDALNTTLSGLQDDPWLAQRVIAEMKGEKKMKRKISFGLVLALVLALAAVTALAVSLTSYFKGFAELESAYGEYERWPDSAKVKLAELMLESGVLSADDAVQWPEALAEQEKAAELILSNYFSGMAYVDTYNVMVRELGPMERWSDEERALYISLLEQCGKLTDSWPIYQVPGEGDLSRTQAVEQARDAVLSKFSISEEELDALTIDAIFAADAYNSYGVSANDPFWIVEFGYGDAYRVYMTKTGDMLGVMGPQTTWIPWGAGLMDGAVAATPGIYDVTREEAILHARSALLEVVNLSDNEVSSMDASARFIYDGRYCDGKEPVWIVSWNRMGKVLWNVLLGYDGSYIDAEPTGKMFDRVLREYLSLADLWRERCGELGMTEQFFNESGGYYYNWTLEEKAAFSKMWVPIVKEYESENPYCHEEGSGVWEWTRNINGLPDEKAISQDTAIAIALKAIGENFGEQLSENDVSVFYFVTNPEKPEWRIATASRYVTVDAYSGTVVTVEKNSDEGPYRTISDFLSR